MPDRTVVFLAILAIWYVFTKRNHVFLSQSIFISVNTNGSIIVNLVHYSWTFCFVTDSSWCWCDGHLKTSRQGAVPKIISIVHFGGS
jgi:hypothetical protein